jgi:hypothetical protein
LEELIIFQEVASTLGPEADLWAHGHFVLRCAISWASAVLVDAGLLCDAARVAEFGGSSC